MSAAPAYDNLYALAIDARAAAIDRLMALLAPDAPDAPDPDRHRRLLALLIRATASPILAARTTTTQNRQATQPPRERPLAAAYQSRAPTPAPIPTPAHTPPHQPPPPTPTPPPRTTPPHHAAPARPTTPLPTPRPTPGRTQPPHLPARTPSRASTLLAHAGASTHPP